MERTTAINEAKAVMGSNFIGTHELTLIVDKISINVPKEIPSIPFSLEELKNKQIDYILILGTSYMQNGSPLSLKTLRDYFGVDPLISEPCFYNQDWYLKEEFFNKQLDNKWYLIRKSIIDETRAQNPDYPALKISFPSAILCAYTFFVYWFYSAKHLWGNDYIWCSDHDHNGDRVYIGRYIDPNGINKNGFSIHRHLAIRNNYGCINAL